MMKGSWYGKQIKISQNGEIPGTRNRSVGSVHEIIVIHDPFD